MNIDFGDQVLEKAQELSRQGIDPNQAAKVLFDQDPEGRNYGIGIILGGDGKPYPTSPTLLAYARKEIERSGAGTYMNSDRLKQPLKEAVLRWQRVPEAHWDDFALALPSDAGTGAVRTAVEVAAMLRPNVATLGVEELGWPAYRAIARAQRLDFKAFPQEGVIAEDGVLPLYQAGPMNTTGLVQTEATVRARAEAAAARGDLVLLDRAYSGFEFARRLGADAYDAVMRRSYALQMAPFIEAGTPFLAAVSPTKAFVTFALRPAGLLLVYTPGGAGKKEAATAAVTAMRARGSSFEHPVTRAFAAALTESLPALEAEHEAAMRRVAEAEESWQRLSAGTPIEYLFSDRYAGLFRNPQAHPEAGRRLYGSHLYPVFSESRCRMNVTGLPLDEAVAGEHVAAFAGQCL